MNFYVLLSIFMALVIIRHKRYSARLGVFFTFLLFFLSAFRGEKVGHDTESYIAYEYVQQSADFSITSFADFKDFDNSIELISNLINKLVVLLGVDGRWVIIAYAIIMMIFMYKSAKRVRGDVSFTLAFYVLLGFYFYSLSACRQLCAVSVLLYAMTFLQRDEKRPNLFFIWVLVAVFIHSMSFICAPLYYIRKFPQYDSYKRIGGFVLLMSLLLTLVRIDFLNQLSILANSDHLSNYLDSYGETGTNLSSIASCWIESICLFYFFLLKKKADVVKSMTAFDYLFLLSIFISAALIQYDGLIARVKYNIIIMQCIYLAGIFVIKSLWGKQANVIMILFLLIRILKNYNFEIALESDYYLGF